MDDDRIVDWKGLQALGWSYSPTQTVRHMKAGKFPQCFKLDDTRSSHRFWWLREVIACLKARQR